MTESAYSSIHGAEISERSTELVLPSSAAGSAREEIVDVGAISSDHGEGSWRTAPLVTPSGDPRQSGLGDVSLLAAPAPGAAAVLAGAGNASVDTSISTSSDTSNGFGVSEPASSQRGFALPGDRGPRDLEGGSQRPSFWRRIALGRRAQTLRTEPVGTAADSARFTSAEEAEGEVAIGQVLAARRALATRETNAVAARATESVERRIVEPLLQALVSVEAKLERSHVDLIGRSDQVEQRLTQLWDIEEQLGALGELQESVLQVTEQQRRLESALVAQTRILRWLVGGIILSLAVAAFSVAFFLRVSG